MISLNNNNINNIIKDKMFKNMSYTHNLVRSKNGGFSLYIYTRRDIRLQNINMVIYTNKLIDGVMFDCNLEDHINYKRNNKQW